jgi:hypothetical protein
MDDEGLRQLRAGTSAAAELAESVAKTVIGMDEAAALTTAKDAGLIVRITQRDGTRTLEYCSTRINVSIVNGTVTAAFVG